MNKENFEEHSETMAEFLNFIMGTEIGRYIVFGGILYVVLRISKHYMRAAGETIVAYKELMIAVNS